MTDFSKCNYLSGYYTSADKIENFTFRVTIKEISRNTLLAASSETVEESCDDLGSDDSQFYQEKIFKWQEKVSRSAERAHETEEDVASDVATSANEENEKNIKNSDRLISYIDPDKYEPVVKLTNNPREVHELNKGFEGLSIPVKLTTENIFKYQDDQNRPNTEDQKMFIAVIMDDADRNVSEHVLFVITWQPEENCLVISPDFNDIKTNPYILERHDDSKKLFHYSIEKISTNTNDEDKLMEMNLLYKISQYENDSRMRKMFHKFPLPPKNLLRCVVIIEILSACLFEYDNLYVEYVIDIPDGYKCNDSLKGTTQVTKTIGKKKIANFSHLLELSIDYYMEDIKEGLLPRNPQIFFEIISCDSWERHRTEGYCYVKLPITQPGFKRVTLNAFNPQSLNKIRWNMERYFIGGCHSLKDITSIAIPNTFQGDCLVKYGMTCVSTGYLDIAMNIILQSDSFAADKNQTNVIEKLNVNSLFKSVNAVLTAYKSAEKKFKESLQKTLNNTDKDDK